MTQAKTIIEMDYDEAQSIKANIVRMLNEYDNKRTASNKAAAKTTEAK